MSHLVLIVKVKNEEIDYRKHIVKLIEVHLPFDKIEIPENDINLN